MTLALKYVAAQTRKRVNIIFECHCPPAASVLASESKWPPLLTTWVNYREQHFDNSCFRSISAACVANKYPIVLAVFPTIMHGGSRTQWYWTTPLWQRLAGSKLLSLCKQHESGSGAEDVTECFFFLFRYLSAGSNRQWFAQSGAAVQESHGAGQNLLKPNRVVHTHTFTVF